MGYAIKVLDDGIRQAVWGGEEEEAVRAAENELAEAQRKLDEARASHDRLGKGVSMLVMADGEGKLFKRRGVKRPPSGETCETMWLVGELNGVRAYVDRDDCGSVTVVMTTQDLNP